MKEKWGGVVRKLRFGGKDGFTRERERNKMLVLFVLR
jgi:hypothetical protein